MGSVKIKRDTGKSSQPVESAIRPTAIRQSSRVKSILHAGRSERLQAKLRINTPGDVFEQEADRVAEQVMRMPEPRLSSSIGNSSPSIDGGQRLTTTSANTRRHTARGLEMPLVFPIVRHRTNTSMAQRTPPPEASPKQPIINKNIIVTSKVGPTFHGCNHAAPQFRWGVDFSPTAKDGWIIQRIKSTYDARNCDGTPGNCDGTSNNHIVVLPEYWEAWEIASGGPIPAYADGHDTWMRPIDTPTCGEWSMEGKLYVAEILPIQSPGNPQGFAVGNVREARDAWSTVHQPSRAVLGSPVGNRKIKGEWNCCPTAGSQFHREKK